LKLIRFRNKYPAFNGEFTVLETDDTCLSLGWETGENMCRLDVDLTTSRAEITCRDDTGRNMIYAI
jgi:sucrose phosphorylase